MPWTDIITMGTAALLEPVGATEVSGSTLALGVTVLAQFAAVLVWGAALTQRVRALERDIEPLKALDVRVARIEARLETLVEQLRDLNAALRWMRPMPDRGAEA